MSALRVGLVGVGDAGGHHARALAQHHGRSLAWTAVCARDAGRALAFARDHGGPADVRAFASLDSLLEARCCDAVILATPDGLHAAQIEACARAGAHVLSEKPLALTHAEGLAAARACEAAGVVLEVGYHLRHHAAHRRMREELASLGTLRHVDVRWAWPDPAIDGWRARGEQARCWALAALGTHAIDLVLWLAGGRAPLEAHGVRMPAHGPDRTSELVLRFDGELLAHVWVAVTHRAISRVTLSGDNGELECVGTLGARGGGTLTRRLGRAEPEALPFDAADPYAAQLEAFVARARAGTASGGAEDALVSLALVDAAFPGL